MSDIEFFPEESESEFTSSEFTSTPTPPRSHKVSKKAANVNLAQVKLVNTTVYGGKYLVYRLDDISQVYLVSADHLQFSVKEQLINEDILNASEKPYDWYEEINAIWPSPDAVRLAVYRNGLIRKEDLLDRQMSNMALYGAFPNRFKGDK